MNGSLNGPCSCNVSFASYFLHGHWPHSKEFLFMAHCYGLPCMFHLPYFLLMASFSTSASWFTPRMVAMRSSAVRPLLELDASAQWYALRTKSFAANSCYGHCSLTHAWPSCTQWIHHAFHLWQSQATCSVVSRSCWKVSSRTCDTLQSQGEQTSCCTSLLNM
jgi:hypothetical protein